MQKVFNKMHLLMAANALAAYPDHNERFNVGTCIIQEEMRVAYFSCKLTKSQQNYTTMEKRNAFHRCNSQRILRYAPWCGHSCFYGS